MKTIFKSVMILLGGAFLLAACEDDNHSNPTLQQPDTFGLATPGFIHETVDLAGTSTLAFDWGLPDYGGFPVVANYQLQLSLTGSYTVSFAQAQVDESGATVADYYELDPVSATRIDAAAADITRGLNGIAGWEEDAVPAVVDVHARVKASLNGAKDVYSNEVTFKAVPYYLPLTPAAPQLWYLIGACIGNGEWTNEAGAIGNPLTPMYPKPGETYNPSDGTGLISYTGYLTTDGFKLIRVPGSWDDEWGQSDGNYVKNTPGSGNITVAKDGYYTIELNTKEDKLNITAYEGEPAVYDQIFITGEFDNWAVTTKMQPVHTFEGAKNHDWYFDLTLDADSELKFTTEGWATEWGKDAEASDVFPYGYGVKGDNLSVPAGSYHVFLNDITGAYQFISKE